MAIALGSGNQLRTDGVTVGVVDIGSNTVHLIIARTDGRDVEVLVDDKEMARLGDDVSFRGEISPAKFDLVLRLLSDYDRQAKASNTRLIIFGTEPLRAAHNAAHLVQQAREQLGLTLNVFSQTEEALFSFRGATARLCLPSHFVVADIGGGSTEIVMVDFNQITNIVELPVGSIKLRAITKASDPLTHAQVHAAQFKLGEIFAAGRWPMMHGAFELGVVAGGNAKAVTRLFNKGRRGEILSRDEVAQAVTLATTRPSAQLAVVYNLVPSRAQTFGTGALIMGALMDKFGLENVNVSKFGIREGVLLSYAYYGEHWRDSLRLPG
jgi:exopolyphosphatase / guanosine-5'-triphosphate,3'-diphosphate pyrophosphatase